MEHFQINSVFLSDIIGARNSFANREINLFHENSYASRNMLNELERHLSEKENTKMIRFSVEEDKICYLLFSLCLKSTDGRIKNKRKKH